MIKPQILDKNQSIMKEMIGTAIHKRNDEEEIVIIGRSLSGMNIIVDYKGESVIWNVKDMVKKSIELIDGEESEEQHA